MITLKDMPKVLRIRVMLALCLQDIQDITMLKILHNGEMKETSKEGHSNKMRKLETVVDWTENLCPIEKSDMQTGNTECVRNSLM